MFVIVLCSTFCTVCSLCYSVMHVFVVFKVGVKMSDCAHCSVIVLVFVLAFVLVFALVFVLMHVCTVSECHLICAFCSHLRLYVSVGDDDRAAMLSHGVV